MNFSEFCQPFYGENKAACGLKSAVSQVAIPKFFMYTALPEESHTLLHLGDDSFRKWFKGTREPQPDLWEHVAKLDEVSFSRAVSCVINENNLLRMMNVFGIVLSANEESDKFAFTSALAKQLKAIALGNGHAENTMQQNYHASMDRTEFPTYIAEAGKKWSKLKTLLYSSEEHLFRDFFVCNRIVTDVRHSQIGMRYSFSDGEVIENVTGQKLLSKSRYCILTGMGGIGKSMMMRHLFLTAIDQHAKSGVFPILVILREFGTEKGTLLDCIVDSVHRFDLSFTSAHAHRLLASGQCLLLFDGLDEIHAQYMQSFQRQLDALIDRYPENQIVLSTRRFSSFVEYQRFTLLGMMPFNQAQALELIDKLDFCRDEPKLREQFREKLLSEYYESHNEFVTNPLLLTLMLMNYRRFCDIPEKRYLFYEQAYETLLRRHDNDKVAYRRAFRSVSDPSEFTRVFREFCAKSYRKGIYEFDRKRFESVFNSLKSTERHNPDMMTVDNFLFDILHSVCMMYEEGQTYHFLHRSFQEYFFADYYSRQDEKVLHKVAEYMENKASNQYDDGPALRMLYDLEPEKVERYIILPFLTSIFSETDNTYLHFLDRFYESWNYAQFDMPVLANYGIVEPNRIFLGPFYELVETWSRTLELVLSILHIDYSRYPEPSIYNFDYQELAQEDLIGRIDRWRRKDDELLFLLAFSQPHSGISKEQMESDEEYAKTFIRNEDGSPRVIGKSYRFPYKKAIDFPDKYKDIVDHIQNPKWPTMRIFIRIQNYYARLCQQYPNGSDSEEDDF